MSDDLPNGWTLTTIGDVCASKVVQRSPEQDFLYIDIGSVDNQRKQIIEPSRLAANSAPSRARQVLREGDILVSLTRPNLNAVAMVPSDLDGSIGSTGFDVLRAVGCDTRWLFAFVRGPAFVARMSGLVQGALYPAVRSRDVRETAFPLPPLNEQRRIVAKLEALQARSRRAREALDAVPPLLEKLRQSILAAAFAGTLTADWRAKHKYVEPASELLKRIRTERRKKWEEAELAKLKAKGRPPTDDKWKSKYKEPEPVDTAGLPELPEGWCWASLGLLAWSVKDGPHHTPKYSEAGVPFISGRNVRPEGIDFTTAKFISRELHAEYSERCRPEVNDVLYTKGGTTGIARVNTYDVDFNVWVHVAVLKLTDAVWPFYVQHALNAPHCYQQSQVLTHGVGNQDLGLTRMVNITLPVAPKQEQAEIIRVVDSWTEVLRSLAQRAGTVRPGVDALERALLAKGFRGELVPHDPNDEPGEAMIAHAVGANDTGTNGAHRASAKGKRGRGGMSGAVEET